MNPNELKKSISQQAYHAIFTNLSTLLKNESKRTEEINMKAIRYWIDYTVPEPPTEPPPSARIPSDSFTRRIGLHSTNVFTDIGSIALSQPTYHGGA
jgi:hypothetical protein